jgi:hypothetical protein
MSTLSPEVKHSESEVISDVSASDLHVIKSPATLEAPEAEAVDEQTKALDEYLDNNPPFSEAWHRYAQVLMTQFASGSSDNITVLKSPRQLAQESSTLSQITHLAERAHTTLAPEVIYLYTVLRVASSLNVDDTDKTGSHPPGMTDERLAIEICLLVDDVLPVHALIAHHPTVRMPVAA